MATCIIVWASLFCFNIFYCPIIITYKAIMKQQ